MHVRVCACPCATRRAGVFLLGKLQWRNEDKQRAQTRFPECLNFQGLRASLWDTAALTQFRREVEGGDEVPEPRRGSFIGSPHGELRLLKTSPSIPLGPWGGASYPTASRCCSEETEEFVRVRVCACTRDVGDIRRQLCLCLTQTSDSCVCGQETQIRRYWFSYRTTHENEL